MQSLKRSEVYWNSSSLSQTKSGLKRQRRKEKTEFPPEKSLIALYYTYIMYYDTTREMIHL